jgi:transcriptional regulator with XRE-family HTH domain
MNVMVEQQQGTQLADLVRTRRAEKGLSLRAMAELCIDPETGEQLAKYSWIDRLEKGQPVVPPQLPQLTAMAAALDLPVRLLKEAAAAQFMGVETGEWSADGTVRAVAAHMEEMTPAERKELALIAEMFARRRRSDQ